jgi:hypothetical protein
MNRNPKRDLAGNRRLVRAALVARKLKFKVFRSSAHTFQYFERNPELTIAYGAHRDSRRSSQPLQHPEIAFWHTPFYATLTHRVLNLLTEVSLLARFARWDRYWSDRPD